MKNKQGITIYEIKTKLKARCPLGDQNYEAKVKIKVLRPAVYPDFLELDAKLHNLPKDMIVEEMAEAVHETVKESFGEALTNVSISVGQSKHFPVTVRKKDF